MSQPEKFYLRLSNGMYVTADANGNFGIFLANGTEMLTIPAASSGAFSLAANVNFTSGTIGKIQNIATAGSLGIPAIYATARSVAQVAAVASVTSFTPSADGSFIVSANVLVTTSTTHAFTCTCAYTDEGNTARTATLSFQLLAGGTPVTSVANANGAVPYMGVPQQIRAKASTGTFTTVTYNVEGLIVQVA
jgi:hypothetical protein